MSAKNSHYFWRLSCRIIILFAGFWEICLETPMNPLCKISSLPMFRVNLVSCSTVPVHLSSTYHVWQVTTSTQPFHFGWRTRATILSSSTTMCSTFMRWLQINMGTLQASMCCICSVLLLLDGTPPGKFAVLSFSLVVKKILLAQVHTIPHCASIINKSVPIPYDLIGVSVSKHHTSRFNCDFSYIYIYIYIIIWRTLFRIPLML